MISTEEYIKQVKKHLAKSGNEISPDKLTEVKDKAERTLKEITTNHIRERSLVPATINQIERDPCPKAIDERPQRPR